MRHNPFARIRTTVDNAMLGCENTVKFYCTLVVEYLSGRSAMHDTPAT